MDQPLSNGDISRAFDGKCRVISYPELSKFSSVEQLLKPHGKCIILYLSTARSGHWVLLFKYPGKNTVELFDPYGQMPDLGPMKPDAELDFVTPSKRLKLGMGRPYLSNLLEDYARKKGHRVEYNNYPFQQWDEGVQTCGRWCITRGFLDDMTLKQFAKFMLKHPNPDAFVTEFTDCIL